MKATFALLSAGLHLAAAPTFAAMAVLTHFLRQGAMDMLCMGGGFALGGMVPMYLLMSAFHLAPWLKLAAGRHGLPDRSAT